MWLKNAKDGAFFQFFSSFGNLCLHLRPLDTFARSWTLNLDGEKPTSKSSCKDRGLTVPLLYLSLLLTGTLFTIKSGNIESPSGPRNYLGAYIDSKYATLTRRCTRFRGEATNFSLTDTLYHY
jgi:hypothetical protein